MSNWSIDPTEFAKSLTTDVEKHVKKIAGEALQQVMTRSPVDEGTYRLSHIVSVNTEDHSAKGNGDPIQSGAAAISQFKLGDKIYIQTNSPYGSVIEYGGYPNPPKKGSYVKGKGHVVKSSGGFSRQAPNGVYTLAFQYIASKYK